MKWEGVDSHNKNPSPRFEDFRNLVSHQPGMFQVFVNSAGKDQIKTPLTEYL